MSLFDRAARFVDDVLLLPEEVRVALAHAEAMLEGGRAKDAEVAFRRILETRPQLGRAALGWTLALLALGDLAGARVALAEAQRSLPDDPRVTLASARLALEAGELGAALAASREAARRLAAEGGRNFAAACAIRAEVESRRGRADRAVRELRKAVAAAPDEPSHRVALTVALAEARDRAGAVRAAREVPADRVAIADALAVGLALSKIGEAEAAETWLHRAAASGESRAILALARLALRAGDVALAERRARMAVARGGGAEALVFLSEVLSHEGEDGSVDAAARRDDEAGQAAIAAAAVSADPELFVRAARLVPLRDPSTLERAADDIERAMPGYGGARALRAWARLVRGQIDEARALVDETSSEPRALLALARIALEDGDPSRALALLDRAEAGAGPPRRSDARVAQAMRRDALRALWRDRRGEVDLAAAIDGVATFARDRGLIDGERRALALRDELDRPLLLAILGEFNAGKSTLVNAFLGADVAPTGVLPTTATLNVLRGGAERRVRVVRKDGTTREGDYAVLRDLLRDAEAEDAEVDRVEITWPSEILERVWILDAPGSNAPSPAHEALAQEALRRADVALWVFDAAQAGKATEGRVLSAIRASKREVIAVLNKVDRLAQSDLERVMAALLDAMPELGARPVALSARGALRARLTSDEDAYVASGFPALLERLERDVFSRSRALKRRACAGRLLELLADALATESDAVSGFRQAAAEACAAARIVRQLASQAFSEVDCALDEVEEGQSHALVEAAREVISFVRPAVGRFGAHEADPEDRAFLAEVLHARFEQVADRVATRLSVAFAERLGATVPSPEPGWLELVRARVAMAVAVPFAHFLGHQEAALEAGALRRFFDEVLPTLPLSEVAVAEALATVRAHPREVLRPRLEGSLRALCEELADELERRAKASLEAQRALVAGTYEPLRALRDVLGELTS